MVPQPSLFRSAGALLLAGVLACGGGSGGGSTPLPEERPLALVSPSDGGATPSLSPTLRWNPIEGAARYDLEAWADAERTAPVTAISSGEPRAALPVTLADGDRLWVDVTARGAGDEILGTRTSRFKVVVVPEAFPEFTAVSYDGRRVQEGYTLFNLQDPLPPDARERLAALVLVNRAGEVLWWHQRPRGFITDARVLPNQNLLFIYRPDLTAPTAIEMTFDGQELWRARDGALPHHEVSLGPDGGYLYLTALARDVGGFTFEGDGLELVDPVSGAVRWTWDIFDHVSTDERDPRDILLPGLTGLGLDWTHSNAAVWDEARSVIWVSVRNLDRMLAVDYPSGEIRAVIGEGGLGGEGLMDHQHSPQVQPDGSILFFDNGPRREPNYSRVAAFQWDERRGTVRETFEWREDPDFFDGTVGDADRLANGNLLVASGTASLIPQKNARLMEVAPDGTVVWDLRVAGGFRLLGFWIYRAERVTADELPLGVLPFDDDPDGP